MENQEYGRESFEHVRSTIGRVRAKADEVGEEMPAVIENARLQGIRIADQLPGKLDQIRAGAQGALANLQTVPDSQLRLLAGVFVGVGAGLQLGGKRRLAALAGFVPASIFGLAIMSRPQPTHR